MKKNKMAALLFLLTLTAGQAWAKKSADGNSCKSFESWVGNGKINIVDFRGNDETSPFRFRLKFHNFEQVKSDGFMGPITRGSMTFSYPRQAKPEVAYVKSAAYPAPFTLGPAFGEKIEYQAREVSCNVFEVHWKEPKKGDTVTHVQDYNKQHVCTNITNINREPIPAGFDPFDLSAQMNNKSLFPKGSPLLKDGFGWYNLCGKMAQSLERDRVWENKFGFLVYEAP
ncbi:hypothetical protein K2P97_10610 [bacterium]|nr:hypothetical protein [bacterium]